MEIKSKLKQSKSLRKFFPLFVILIWLIIGGFGGPTFNKLNSVSSNDQTSYLPASSDSTKVSALQQKFLSSSTLPAIVVIKLASTYQLSDFAKYKSIAHNLSRVTGVNQGTHAVIGPIISKDGQAVEYIVQINANSTLNDVVKAMRTQLNREVLNGTTAYVTGPVGLTADLISAFGGIDGILLIVALIAVFVILLFVYRSFFLPLLVLMNAMFALSGAILLVYVLARHNVVKLNGQSQGILSILVIGATTDYSLLLISRFREALGHTTSKWTALKEAYRLSFEPIIASAATVILALLCLLFSDLNSNRSLGPIAALGIVFAFFSVASLLPSFLLLFGRTAFWPFIPKFNTQSVETKYQNLKTGIEDRTGLWHKVADFIAKRYRFIWIILFITLLGCSLGLTQLKASGISESDSILGNSNAVSGQGVQSAHFSAGTGSPIEIVSFAYGSSKVFETVSKTHGIVATSYLLDHNTNKPKIVDGKVIINAELAYNPSSQSAENVVSALRIRLAKVNRYALVGGVTAVRLDSNNTSNADLHKIIPIVLVVILIILMLLLRSLIAPVILVLSVILSFAASLGVSALVFNHIFHFPGSDASVPLFSFIFLVALGIDYNIFLMSRVREEAKKLGTRPGILRGLSLTGGVITSAGIVLATTFAALAIIPILFLVQIAFIVSFGVLLDSIIVRSLLVPAITFQISRYIWWPSKLSQK